ncbi:autotransporter outer membrane beta-barrel domain-containing protein [Morganella sp. GD04133]|uniref:autotransporter outer membrane beta-barrel domain-containing protein n=1 Tax=Morganella sp. GD04133 TaxID=2975435 RepID=UPI002448367B|nr:autotransporter outer membrane beta-barrel domain-containing protein [Morganella sp. GD04133]MDH0353973.1 autotransporter outer membrane beta-barrel domain-containing protein [Morganella sp. GD04133]
MKPKKKILHLAILSVIFTTAPSLVMAETFCGDRGSITYGGSSTLTGELTADQCYEVGASVIGDPADYIGIAKELTLLSGSKLSVLGLFEDSRVQGGAEAWIGKNTNIAVDGYHTGFPATGSRIDIQSGGLIRVLDGGTLKDSVLNGGTVYVSNTGTADDPGQSENNTVNSGGKLFIYLGGESTGTQVNDGGYEYVQQDGKSLDTVVNNGGLQQLHGKGFADNTLVNAGARQYVVDDSKATNTTVDGGQQYIFRQNTTAAAGIAEVNRIKNGGAQIIKGGGQAINNKLYDTAVQRIYEASSATDTTLSDRAKSWLAAGAQLLGVTTVNQQSQVQLTAGAEDRLAADAGAYAENIILSGTDSTLLVITGDTGNTAFAGSLSGQGQVRFVAPVNAGYSHLTIDNLSGSQTFYMNTAIAEQQGDYLTIRNGSGDHALNVQDSGAEITRPDESRLDVITDESSNAQFRLSALDGTNINAVDSGTYMYSLYQRDEQNGKIWYLAAQKDDNTGEPGEPEKPVPPVVPDNKTTPSTDAVLSMSAAPQLIFNHELDNLRFRRGELRDNQGDAGVWVRLTGDRTRAGTGHTHFKLNQAGFELGADKSVPLENGKLWLGVFTGYNDVKLKHQRGGESSIDSVTAGGYATWFSDNGWYLDGVLKYNHFNNELRAVSTNRSSIRGDYSQNAYGASAEAGYSFDLPDAFRTEPYARLSYMRADSKSVHLNNNMQAKLDAQQSLQSELGLHAGKDFTLNNQVIITPYATLAWQHEFISNNDVTINQRNTFDTDFSGDSLKAGGGLTVRFTPQIQAYAEIDYRKGDKTESPLHGNIGVRYNF